MKAVYFNEVGSPEVLIYGELPEPPVGANDVLIRVRTCSLNRLDVFTREGSHGTRFTPPHVLGGDFAGEVVHVGAGVEGLQPGDRVIANGRGGYAEFAVARAERVYSLPERCTFDEGATLPVAGLTAWQMVMNRARVQPGETVLITAAGSGVSTFAIQLCHTLGARVIATAGSEDKLDKARALGAEAGIHHRQEDILEGVRAFTAGEGVDVPGTYRNTGLESLLREPEARRTLRHVRCDRWASRGVASRPRVFARADDHGGGAGHPRRHAGLPQSGRSGQSSWHRPPHIPPGSSGGGAPRHGSLELFRQVGVESVRILCRRPGGRLPHNAGLVAIDNEASAQPMNSV